WARPASIATRFSEGIFPATRLTAAGRFSGSYRNKQLPLNNKPGRTSPGLLFCPGTQIEELSDSGQLSPSADDFPESSWARCCRYGSFCSSRQELRLLHSDSGTGGSGVDH